LAVLPPMNLWVVWNRVPIVEHIAVDLGWQPAALMHYSSCSSLRYAYLAFPSGISFV
jgi:hypothetical protein